MNGRLKARILVLLAMTRTGLHWPRLRRAVRSWDLAIAAPSPGCAAGGREITEPEGIDPAPAAAATSSATDAAAAASASGATSTACAASGASAAAAPATTASPRELHAAAEVFTIDEMEGGEADVGKFFFTERHYLARREVRPWLNVRRRYGCCRCASRQRESQSGGSQRRHGGFGYALLRSFLHPLHGRILQKF
jgi:hypothetical protein